MRKWLVIGVVVLLVAAGVTWFYARPLLAVRDLKAALQARDPQAVALRIDFPTLKANTRAAGKNKVEQANDGKILEGLRDWIGGELVDSAIDKIGTPEGFIRLACDGKTDGLPTPPGEPCAFKGHLETYRYLSGDRFRIDVRKADGKAMGLVMGKTPGSKRWRLVDLVDVPSKAAGFVMKRNLIVIAVIVLLVVVFALVATPLIAVQSLRDALVTRNDGKIAELVDPARLRASAASRTGDYFGSTSGAANQATDRLLTPQGLIAAICDAGLATPPGAAAPFCPISASLGDLRFASPSRFSAALSRPDGVAATVVMDREGLKWRVVDIVLPGSVYDRLRAPLPR